MSSGTPTDGAPPPFTLLDYLDLNFSSTLGADAADVFGPVQFSNTSAMQEPSYFPPSGGITGSASESYIQREPTSQAASAGSTQSVAGQFPLSDHSYGAGLFDNFDSQEDMLDLSPVMHTQQRYPDTVQTSNTIYDQSFGLPLSSTGFQPFDISSRTFEFQGPVSRASGSRGRHSRQVHRGANLSQTQTAGTFAAVVRDASNAYASTTASPSTEAGGGQLLQEVKASQHPQAISSLSASMQITTTPPSTNTECSRDESENSTSAPKRQRSAPKKKSTAPNNDSSAPRPRKPRTKKVVTVTAGTLDLKLPGPGYDFATDDIYLVPRPSKRFGKYDPELEDKVLVAADEIRSRKTQPRPVSQTQGLRQTAFWLSLANDFSIPITQQDYDTCQGLLEDAINYNGVEVMEVRDTGEFKNKWINCTHYDHGFARILARQILDALIALHRHGWTHYVLDPAFRDEYEKTKYFTFRERFNLVAGVLKHSKHTCADLMKGERLYDVVGRSYEIEVRVWQNKKANDDRRRRLAAGKKAEAEAAEKAQKDAAGTKRTHDEDDAGNFAEDISVAQKSRKRQKSKDSTRPGSDDTISATAASEASSSAVKITRPPNRKLVTLQSPALQNALSWPTSAGISPQDNVADSLQANASGGDGPKLKRTKRDLTDEDELQGHVAPPLKKTESKSRTVAPKNMSSTKATTEPIHSARRSDDEHSGSGHVRTLRSRRSAPTPGAEASFQSSTF